MHPNSSSNRPQAASKITDKTAAKVVAKTTSSTAVKAEAKPVNKPVSKPTVAAKVKPAVASTWVPTEVELRAMPEADYMNVAQLRYFKQLLENTRGEIFVNAGNTTEHLRESNIVPDPADRATIEEEHALELRTRDRERKLLKKIAQVIDMIDKGEYGWCEETGDAIGIPRLLARPTATLTLEAQQRREIKQKMYGD